MLRKKQELLQQLLIKKGVDALFVNNKENLFYLTGIKSADNRLIMTKKNIYFFLTPLEIGTHKIYKNIQVLELNSKNLQSVIKKEKINTLGYKKNHLTIESLENIQKIFGKNINYQGFNDIFSKIRVQKFPDEIKKLQKSAKIADQVMNKIIKLFKIGITEKELAWKIEQIGRDLGAEKVSFDPLVAFGKNSAVPHHKVSTKKLEKNMPLLLDLGFIVDGYCSDITRSFYYGKTTNEWQKNYNLVKKSKEEAEKIIKIGLPCKKAHQKAQEIFAQEKKYFIHSLGHGVGINIHEEPRISEKSTDIFMENMVFSVEPGLYYPNKFGIRLEDTCYLSKKGLINLNQTKI